VSRRPVRRILEWCAEAIPGFVSVRLVQAAGFTYRVGGASFFQSQPIPMRRSGGEGIRDAGRAWAVDLYAGRGCFHSLSRQFSRVRQSSPALRRCGPALQHRTGGASWKSLRHDEDFLRGCRPADSCWPIRPDGLGRAVVAACRRSSRRAVILCLRSGTLRGICAGCSRWLSD